MGVQDGKPVRDGDDCQRSLRSGLCRDCSAVCGTLRSWIFPRRGSQRGDDCRNTYGHVGCRRFLRQEAWLGRLNLPRMTSLEIVDKNGRPRRSRGHPFATRRSRLRWRSGGARRIRVTDACNFTAGTVTRHMHCYTGNTSEMNLDLSYDRRGQTLGHWSGLPQFRPYRCAAPTDATSHHHCRSD